MLQTRNGKRTAAASLRIAVEMAHEGLIDQKEAVQRVNPAALDQLLHPTLDPNARRTLLAKGLPASPGAASGAVVFSADEAESRAVKGEAVILVRVETSPEDIHGMNAARGILTTRGGMTSHAAVVARGMGRACVAGAGGIVVDYNAQTLSTAGRVVRAGEIITLDGATGEVFLGLVGMVEPALSGDFGTLMQWADANRRLGIRANAETPLDAETAKKFGAEGIGLCRTEHMFFDPERIGAVRQMIMARDEAGRRTALARLLPFQRDDFHKLFRIMAGLPVTIRLLDPPLHEFLPHAHAELAAVAAALGTDVEAMRRRATELAEANPMLGHRGCRLGISYPEIYEMQARAIFEGAIAVARESGTAPIPEIMIPLIATKKELEITRAQVDKVAQQVFAETGTTIEYTVGTMIELPRAALLADQHRRGGRLLQLRHQRPDADRVRPVARRRGQIPAGLYRAGHPGEGPVRLDRCRGGRRDGAHRHREGPRRQAGAEARHLRRARRRSGLDRVLRGGGAGLRLVQPVPRADRAPRRGAGGAGREGRPDGVSVFYLSRSSRERWRREAPRVRVVPQGPPSPVCASPPRAPEPTAGDGPDDSKGGAGRGDGRCTRCDAMRPSHATVLSLPFAGEGRKADGLARRPGSPTRVAP